MKRIIRFMLGAFVTTSASAATIVPVPELVCSRDLNAWGQASSCGCPSELTYDARVGACLSGEAEKATLKGEISTGVMAIGGETTGLVLATSEDERVELIVPRNLDAELSKAEISGMKFTVTGDIIKLISLETDERPALIVEGIVYQD